MKTMPDVFGRDLDLNLLRVFAVVAEEGSITRAASRLYVTQPAISAAMRRLTSFVGDELFVRQGRGIVLTHRGSELLIAARAHLQPLIAATLATPSFEPFASTATVRLGLSDALETTLLPAFLRLLRERAPHMRLVVVPVQFRTVEDAILTGRVDFAVTVADELPRSILRTPLRPDAKPTGAFVCVYDPRFAKRMPKRLSERVYFAREHVAVSYAGDARGVIEDSLGLARNVRVSVPTLGMVAAVVDGSPLLATVPAGLAVAILATRPHLRSVPLPFTFEPVSLDVLWSRVVDGDPVGRFARDLITRAATVTKR